MAKYKIRKTKKKKEKKEKKKNRTKQNNYLIMMFRRKKTKHNCKFKKKCRNGSHILKKKYT